MASLILLAQAATKPDPTVADELAKQFQEVFIPLLLGTVFLVTLLVGGLMLYFRRGDKAVHARLRDARNAGVQFPGQDDSPSVDGQSDTSQPSHLPPPS